MQIKMQNRSRSVPEKGANVEYLGKKFIVYKTVFPPFEDSKPLVENYKVNSGESVLDICTGCGVIAVFSAYKKARKVVASDVNPEAVRCAKENAKRHGFQGVLDVRLSNMFSAIKEGKQFDVITCNPPFRNKPAKDLVEAAQWDKRFLLHRMFFSDVGKYLKPKGRIYFAQANFGAINEMKQLAKFAGFKARLIGQKSMLDSNPRDPRVFYAFELTQVS